VTRLAFVLGSNGPETLGPLKRLSFAEHDAVRFAQAITAEDAGFVVPDIETREKDGLLGQFDDLVADLRAVRK
jgi:hypothetical protein